MASARAPGSPGGTRNRASQPTRISRLPPTSEATTGIPQAKRLDDRTGERLGPRCSGPRPRRPIRSGGRRPGGARATGRRRCPDLAPQLGPVAVGLLGSVPTVGPPTTTRRKPGRRGGEQAGRLHAARPGLFRGRSDRRRAATKASASMPSVRRVAARSVGAGPGCRCPCRCRCAPRPRCRPAVVVSSPRVLPCRRRRPGSWPRWGGSAGRRRAGGGAAAGRDGAPPGRRVSRPTAEAKGRSRYR